MGAHGAVLVRTHSFRLDFHDRLGLDRRWLQRRHLGNLFNHGTLFELHGSHLGGAESELQAVGDLLDLCLGGVSQIHYDSGDHVRLRLELGDPHSLDRLVLDHDAR